MSPCFQANIRTFHPNSFPSLDLPTTGCRPPNSRDEMCFALELCAERDVPKLGSENTDSAGASNDSPAAVLPTSLLRCYVIIHTYAPTHLISRVHLCTLPRIRNLFGGGGEDIYIYIYILGNRETERQAGRLEGEILRGPRSRTVRLLLPAQPSTMHPSTRFNG